MVSSGTGVRAAGRILRHRDENACATTHTPAFMVGVHARAPEQSLARMCTRDKDVDFVTDVA